MTSEHRNATRSDDERTASFLTSTACRACLVDWARPLAVNDILNLLLDVKSAVATAGDPVILIVVIRESVPVPGNFSLNCLQAAVPAILNCCTELAVVVEGAGIERAAFRSAFNTTRRTLAGQTPPQIFESLGAAFAHAQRFAPHDVLELQRQELQQRFPPNGH